MKKTVFAICTLMLTGAVFAQNKPAVKKAPATAQTAKAAASATKTAAAPETKPAVATTLKNNRDSASYALGVRIAQNLKSQGFDKLDPMLIQKGLNDVLQGKAIQIVEDKLDMCIGQFQDKANAEKSSKAKAEGKKFLTENAKRKGVITTASGLQYEVIRAGSDTAKPKISDKVKCHYHGTLINGTVFDSSVDRGEPISFPVNGVIAGWTEALQMMTVGSKWKLYIPSDLAYGDRQAGPSIAPGSTLIFEVEVLAIEK